MKLWPFRRRKNSTDERVIGPFPPELEQMPTLKYHGLRALCGWLMDRHSDCKSPHPWCGHIPGTTTVQLIAHAIPQVDSESGAFALAIYIARAVGRDTSQDTEPVDQFEYVTSFDYAEKTPDRKLVVSLVSDGTYVASYGPILDPVEGDYSTGNIDYDNARTFYYDAEPSHGRYQYWESNLSAEQVVVPEFRCLHAHGQWWIVDVDRARGMAQQVAGLSVMSNPNHNFGIHSEQQKNSVYITPDDGSELSKVVRENTVYPPFP